MSSRTPKFHASRDSSLSPRERVRGNEEMMSPTTTESRYRVPERVELPIATKSRSPTNANDRSLQTSELSAPTSTSTAAIPPLGSVAKKNRSTIVNGSGNQLAPLQTTSTSKIDSPADQQR